ncbi:ABC transporter substrate-binding protein [Alphaproteobacteria bacterium]|jgi:phospholipid transport system substrate-binding protein|nr:ABC transporter substrate-binding protein [Alphaproteobacteria bacterium]|tara:strand:+ start:232 stop:843 length:612 start_codon:yes stop_codon:yes gene_type:complete
MNFLIKYIFLFFLFLSNSAFSLDTEKAKSFVVEIGNQAIKILKIPVDDKEKRKNELRNLLQEKFDMELISKVILGGPVVKGASDEQLKRFSEIFEIHIVQIYSSQLGTYKGQVFEVNNTEIKKKDAFVYSTITSPDYPTTNIVWRIRERNDIPKVIDMQVEGVSLLRTKKNDFAMILNQIGLKGLIEKLDEMNKNSDLKIPGE